MLKTCWDSSGSSSLCAPSTTRTEGLRLRQRGPERVLAQPGAIGEGEKGASEVGSGGALMGGGGVAPGLCNPLGRGYPFEGGRAVSRGDGGRAPRVGAGLTWE